jgi:hypothetical protein
MCGQRRSRAAAGLATFAVAAACGGEMDLAPAAIRGAGTSGGTATGGELPGGNGAGGTAGVPAATIPAGSVSKEDFTALYPAVVCNNFARCCTGKSTFVAEQCLEARALDVARLLEDPLVAYDPDGGGQCLRAAEAASAGCREINIDPSDSPGNVCESAFAGLAPLGAPCTRGVQCAAPVGATANCSSFGSDVTQRFCMYSLPPRHGSLGEVCENTSDGPVQNCLVVTSVGPLIDCRACYTTDGLYCDGVCRNLAREGDPCQTDCGPGLVCNENNVCQSFPAAGEPCALTFGECQAGLFCDTQRVCEPLRRLGEPCDDTAHCVAATHCGLTTGSCAGPEPNGALCQAPTDCESGVCDPDDGPSIHCTNTVSATRCSSFSDIAA